MDWKDYPRRSDTVALVGFSPTSREQAPFDNHDIEIWTVNEAYNMAWMARYDRLFQMHQQWDWSRNNNANHTNHPQWLRNQTGKCMKCKGSGKVQPINSPTNILDCDECGATGTFVPRGRNLDMPIYMEEAYHDVPGAVFFPLEEVSALIGRKYFRSSFGYMMGLAVLMGYKRIELYGFEMGTDTEYNYQKPNGEYWMGFAQGRGIELYLPDNCTLLKGNLYGYEDSRIGYRQNLEIRRMVLDNQIKKQKVVVEQTGAQAELVKELVAHPETNLKELLYSKAEDYNKALALYNFIRGAKTETENLTKMHDKYYLGPSEAQDPIAYNYKITEENVKVEYAQENK